MREMNQILVPELGEGVREVTFVAWLKTSGNESLLAKLWPKS